MARSGTNTKKCACVSAICRIFGSCSLLVLAAIANSCSSQEEHFQKDYATFVMYAQIAVQEYYERTRTLPRDLGDALPSTRYPRAPYMEWVCYRIRGESEYVLWFRRRDIAERFKGPAVECSETGPQEGDVFGVFNVQGQAGLASWSISH